MSSESLYGRVIVGKGVGKMFGRGFFWDEEIGVLWSKEWWLGDDEIVVWGGLRLESCLKIVWDKVCIVLWYVVVEGIWVMRYMSLEVDLLLM